MLQGVMGSSQKCHHQPTPTVFYLVPTVDCRKPFQARTKGEVNPVSQQFQKANTSPNQLQGAKRISQKCHHVHAPIIFIWSRHDHAAMPRGKRSKGRAIIVSQKCQRVDALPNQLQGASDPARKRHICVAPTEFGPTEGRRNAIDQTPNN